MTEYIDEQLPEPLEGERLDRVVSMLDGCSRSVAAKLIANGAVSLDGNVITQRSVRVTAGQQIRFAATVEEVLTVEADPQVEFQVVYSDDDVIVVHKPAGLIVHPGAGRPDKTLVNGLLARFPEIHDVGQHGRPGIVHRLDGDTSGLLVVARTAAAYDALTAAMARHDVERIYTAVVSGAVSDDRSHASDPRTPVRDRPSGAWRSNLWRSHQPGRLRSRRSTRTATGVRASDFG